MIINSTRYTLTEPQQRARPKKNWVYFLFPELALVVISLIVISCIVAISSPLSIEHTYDPFKASLYSLSGVILGVIFFMLIEGLLVIAFMMVLRMRWSQPILFISFLLIVFGFLLLANSIPVVMYAEFVEEVLLEHQNWPTIMGIAIALLTANGMLLFFTHTIFTIIWNELKQNYMRASKFRGDKKLYTLNEKIIWTYFTQITPVFYFIFSFTLFTDIVFQDKTNEEGIVNKLFREVAENGFGDENIGRISIMALSMLSAVFLVRIFTSLPLRAWEIKHGKSPA